MKRLVTRVTVVGQALLEELGIDLEHLENVHVWVITRSATIGDGRATGIVGHYQRVDLLVVSKPGADRVRQALSKSITRDLEMSTSSGR